MVLGPLVVSQGAAYSGFRNTVRRHEETAVTTLKDRPPLQLLSHRRPKRRGRESHDRDDVIANINTLVDKARNEDVPVIWVQHSE